jgi:LVIVD repeat
MGMMVSSEMGILTEWKKVEQVSVNETECNAIYQPWGGVFYNDGIAMLSGSAQSFSAKTAFAPTAVSQTGIGGSMARFTISGDFLYGLDGANLDVVDVSQQSQPVAKNEIPLSWDVETLFPHENSLFVGSRTGMYILDLTSPAQPSIVSLYLAQRISV